MSEDGGGVKNGETPGQNGEVSDHNQDSGAQIVRDPSKIDPSKLPGPYDEHGKIRPGFVVCPPYRRPKPEVEEPIDSGAQAVVDPSKIDPALLPGPYDEHGNVRPGIAICPPCRRPEPEVEEPIDSGAQAVVDPSKIDPSLLPGPYDEHGNVRPGFVVCPPCRRPEPEVEEPTDESKEGPASPAPSTPKEPTSPKEPSSPKADGATSADTKELSKLFSEQFKLFSKFGDTKSDGRLLSLSQSDKWMKQANVIDGKRITTTDTGIHFKKLKSLKVSEVDYKKFLEDLAKSKKTTSEILKKKMVGCGSPGVTSAVAVSSRYKNV